MIKSGVWVFSEGRLFDAIMTVLGKMPKQSNMDSQAAQILLAKKIIDELREEEELEDDIISEHILDGEQE